MAARLLEMVVRKALEEVVRGQDTDSELLARFARHSNQAAFEELVRRHGPMVLRVCQRGLQHVQDAEDAFQATFLVLARKAATLTRPGSLGGWLHGVATRTVMKVQRSRLRRRELIVDDLSPPAGDSAESATRELNEVVDQEIERLPGNLKSAVVLCYLEGKTNREAATILGCSVNWVEKKLTRARELMRMRLLRRGVGVGSAGLAALLSASSSQARVSPVWLQAAGRRVLEGQASALAVQLAQSVGRYLLLRRWGFLASLALALLVGLNVMTGSTSLMGPVPLSQNPLRLGGHNLPDYLVRFAPDGTQFVSVAAELDGGMIQAQINKIWTLSAPDQP
ncbi:MAG: RNA polymerase sigma factor, partial [Gemmataceae bacterium]